MIISASRRTDIPAFYGTWMLRRLEEGFVRVRNPFAPKRVREILLSPETVDCLVFWTKDIGPFMDYLPKIRDMGYSFCIQHTLTPYGTELEPGLPPKKLLLQNLCRLGDAWSPLPLAWRYDPVIVDATHPVEWHLEQFDRMCKILSGKVNRCIFSFLDIYPNRMKAGSFSSVPKPTMYRLADGFSKSAAACGIPLFTCAEEIDLSPLGISRGACIDPLWISQISGKSLSYKKDRNQRPACGCAESVDIGAYGSCPHQCTYCYASGNRMLGKLPHDPDSPFLLGFPSPEDIVGQAGKR